MITNFPYGAAIFQADGKGDEMGSLTVHVLDGNQKPLQGKKVFCNFPGILPAHSERYTDEDGVARFDDIPVCTVEVYQGGKLRLKVGVGSSNHKDITVTV